MGAIIMEDYVLSIYQSLMNSPVRSDPKVSVDAKKGSNLENDPVVTNGKKVFHAKNSQVMDDDGAAPHLLWKIVGFSWVLLFETWAVSKLMYATYSC